MTDTITLESLIVEQIKRLNAEQLRSVLDFARSLAKVPTPRGIPGDVFWHSLDSIEPFDLEELQRMEQAIEADSEQVDPDGW